MDKEQVNELIQKAKQFTSHEDGQQLTESFEEFIELYHARENFPGDTEFALRLDESHSKFWASFNKAAGRFGITKEFMEEHLRNSPTVQMLKQEVAREIIPSEKKLRKNNKKVRI